MTSRLLLEGLYAVKVISERGPGPSATENNFSVYFEWLPVVRGFELSSLMSLFAKAPIIQFTLRWPQRLVSLHHSFPGSRQVELRCPSSHASDSSARDNHDGHGPGLSYFHRKPCSLPASGWQAFCSPCLLHHGVRGSGNQAAAGISSLLCMNHPNAMFLPHFLKCKWFN